MSSASVRAILVLVVFALVTGCGTITRHKVHHSLVKDQRAKPTRIVLLPVDIRVSEASAGGVVEEVEEWSRQAAQNTVTAIEVITSQDNKFELVKMPSLSEAEMKQLNEYVALYDRVAGNAHGITSFGGEAWRHKLTHFDYTLGEGLAFLREKTGADAAIIVTGRDVVSSAGRKAAFILAAAVGVAIPMGYSAVTAGIVDLQSGDLLWFDYSVSAGDKDLREASDASAMLQDIMKNYPGVEEYRKMISAGK